MYVYKSAIMYGMTAVIRTYSGILYRAQYNR